MEFLVTNDDGIQARGILTLALELAKIGKVTIIAPDREQSATGHGITVHHPLRVQKMTLADNITAYAVDGTPSDCVKLGLQAILPKKPTMVVSGINRGANLGTDVLYSGTVSAAGEGTMHGVPSFAVSVVTDEDGPYDFAAQLARRVAVQINEKGLPPGVLLNINVPPLPVEKIAGLKITKLGIRRYQNVFDKRIDPRGRTYYWLAGEVVDVDTGEESDTKANQANYVTITPIHFDLTDYEFLKELKGWRLSLEDN